jgi:hypothetical protein
MLTQKANVSSNFGNRLNGSILRSPAMLMFYNFAPHGDGANNARRRVGVDERLALCLFFVCECVIPAVVTEIAISEVSEFEPFGA